MRVTLLCRAFGCTQVSNEKDMNRNNWFFVLLALFILSVSFSATAEATEGYAASTGAECKVCHVDPLGGGELTQAGNGYFLSVSDGGRKNKTDRSLISRIFKLAVGYLHVITAFMWFGTILYVHLVLKPAYASKGLPRGEVRVGIVSMVIMAITGSLLTYYKVPSFDLLLTSQFGILLLIKITLFSIMVLSALFVVLVLGPKLKKTQSTAPAEAGLLSLAELASFDGEEGRPAYFAYKNILYDVTHSRLWKNGNHMARHHAGTDLTEMLAQAPHAEEKILAMPVVGKLSEGGERPAPEPQKRIFYFMAYMNLAFVFIIVFILALWRWY